MMIVVMSLAAIILTKRIFNRIIRSGNGMNQSFLNKGLQGSVNGYPVEVLSGIFFDICMSKGSPLFRKSCSIFCRPAVTLNLLAFSIFSIDLIPVINF